MAQATGTTATNDIVGLAEDVEDIIHKLYPMDTYAFNNFKKKKADAVFHQWQTDELAAPAANAKIEGDETAYVAATPTVMLGNYTQISAKSVRVTGTAQVVRKYGRAEEMARLIPKKGRELKRDIEKAILGNQASVAGSDLAARQSAGLEAQTGNNLHGTGSPVGSTPGFSGGLFGAPVDAGTPRAFSETLLKTALEAAWADGGDPSVILLGPKQKAVASTFAGATKFAGVYKEVTGAAQGALVGAVDLYISDFGEHKLRLTRYMRDSVVFCLDPAYLSLAWLRPIRNEQRAITGDNVNSELIGEWTLVCDAPNAHAKIADLS